jgi:hypothetical protein
MLRQLSAVSYQLSVFLLFIPPFGRKWTDFAPVLWAGGSLLTILTNGLTALYPGLHRLVSLEKIPETIPSP